MNRITKIIGALAALGALALGGSALAGATSSSSTSNDPAAATAPVTAPSD